ncbi:MAG: hypothetical protein IT365_23330 [Candidatus Hydrogenedentes bacterium]|nr:hypothetical protein [Candidatus Hydrogenedentota bacterium]
MIRVKATTALLLIGALMPLCAIAEDAAATAKQAEVLARIHFDPRTYALYRPWADKWHEELGKPLAPHRIPEVDGMPLGKSGENYMDLVNWVRTVLSVNAIVSDDGKEYVLDVPAIPGRIRSSYSRLSVDLFLGAFYRQHGLDDAAFQTEKQEIGLRIREIQQSMAEVKEQMDGKTEELERARLEASDETLQSHIAAIEEGPKLELEMNLAEMEARRQAIVDHPTKSLLEIGELTDEQKAIEEKLRLAEREASELKKRVDAGESSAETLNEMENRIAQIKQTLAGQSTTLPARAQTDLALHLAQMLMETEVNLAGLRARHEVLGKEYEQLKARLGHRVELQNTISELEDQRHALNRKVEETQQSLKEDDFRTPPPVIEWVAEEKPAVE